MSTVSVAIPCYNQGAFIDETVDSVLNQTFQDLEIIIVNDGSIDEDTIRILENYNKPKTQVLHTSNQGLAAARNNGIKKSKGKYILPLDADDKIGPSYLEKAVEILDKNEKIGIVYCEAEFFGDRNGRWTLPVYQFPRILINNMIFCSGVFRKSDWDRTDGYRSNIPGWEDHDFWLSIIELEKEVYRIPETLFFYRQHMGSMRQIWARESYINNFSQLFNNHRKLYSDNIGAIFEHIFDLESKAASYASISGTVFYKLWVQWFRIKSHSSRIRKILERSEGSKRGLIR